MKDLDNPTVGPVHLQLFRPSVIRGPCLKQEIVPTYHVCNPVFIQNYF